MCSVDVLQTVMSVCLRPRCEYVFCRRVSDHSVFMCSVDVLQTVPSVCFRPFYGDVRNWRVVLAEDNLEVESGREIYRRIARIVSVSCYTPTSLFRIVQHVIYK